MNIGIIGGGITGLTTALALRKQGISTEVYEQAPELNEIGAGLWLQPNAIRVLDWLGMKDQVKRVGVELDKMEITDHQLRPFREISNDVVEDDAGNRTIAIHRGRLQKILHDELVKSTAVHLGKQYRRHTTAAEGIKLDFVEGETHVDVLLGADGIHSLVRQSLFPHAVLRNSGQLCWRGVAKMNLPDWLKKRGQEAWGKQIRFGFSQVHDDEVYWFAVANEWHLKTVQHTGPKPYLASLFKDFNPVVTELIANTPEEAIHQAVLQDLKRLPSWYHRQVCLLGDAAHATTPNMGQGACQGMEDAYYISRLLSKQIRNAEQAFAEFEKKRRRKVDYIVNTSWQFGKMAHSKLGQSFMKLVMKMTPESVLSSQMSKLYAVET